MSQPLFHKIGSCTDCTLAEEIIKEIDIEIPGFEDIKYEHLSNIKSLSNKGFVNEKEYDTDESNPKAKKMDQVVCCLVWSR